MKPIKIVIEIRGGNLTAVLSNMDLRYVLVDYDNIDNGASPVSGPFEPDGVSDNLYTLYNDPEPADQEIRDALKRLKY